MEYIYTPIAIVKCETLHDRQMSAILDPSLSLIAAGRQVITREIARRERSTSL